MNRITLSLFLTALTTLMAELALVRIFDVIWYANKAYMIITMVMFCFGLAGVQQSLWPLRQNERLRTKLAGLAFFFGLFLILLLPAINSLPLNLANIQASSARDLAAFAAMYLLLATPFFLSGLFFTVIFSVYSQDIQRLYFWDLAGAALGCLILIPFLPHIGPAGALFLGGGLCWITAGLLAEGKLWRNILPLLGIAVAAVPLVKSFNSAHSADRYFEFRHHVSKRGVLESFVAETVEISQWDPISKIDVINTGGAKHIAYDGGTQSSFIYPFDGDYARLRAALPDTTTANFGGQNVYLSHWLKRDSGAETLIIGAAGGQETKAALTFGAKHVDAVELVGFVVNIGTEMYKDYNGGIFNDPRVTTHVDEGRQLPAGFG